MSTSIPPEEDPSKNASPGPEPLAPIRGDDPPEQFRTAIEWFDPERAAMHIRKHSKFQRKPSRATYRKYARDMRAGKWRFNASPVRFNGLDEDGQPMMIDGFHRMQALIEANATMPFFVTYGISQEAMQSGDVGRPRTLGQVLGLNGVKAPDVVARAINLLAVFRAWGGFGGPSFSVEEYVQVLDENPGLRDIAKEYVCKMPRNLKDGLLACAHYLFAEKDPQAANWFCARVLSGTELSAGHPAFEFREWVQSLEKEDKISTAKIGAVLIDCWNKFCQGKTIRRISVPRRVKNLVVLTPQVHQP